MRLIKLIGICALTMGLSLPAMAQNNGELESLNQRNQTEQQVMIDQQGDQSSQEEMSKDLSKAAERASEASKVFSQIMDAPDKAIPDYVLERAEVIAVFPDVFKAGFIVGGRKGNGLVSIRDAATRQWSAPVFLKLAGGSFGAQIGASSTDLILVGMNRGAAETFLQEEFNLGGELSAAAGPVGRSLAAETDVPEFDSQFLSYSRSKGLFAGAEIKGVKISQDEDLNQAVYGQQEFSVFRNVSQRAPAAVMVFVNTLNRYSAGGAEAVSMEKTDNNDPSSELTDSSTPEKTVVKSFVVPDVAADTSISNENATKIDNADTTVQDQTTVNQAESNVETTDDEPVNTTTTNNNQKRVRLSKD
jgi:SH3 domain-containing YSC84-like protein 1